MANENIEEARNRLPALNFRVADAEDPSLWGLTFDLVFLLRIALPNFENPFRAVRNLHALTGKVLCWKAW